MGCAAQGGWGREAEAAECGAAVWELDVRVESGQGRRGEAQWL